MATGGAGVTRAPDGRVAFVAGAFPGDRVRPLRLQEHPRHLEVLAFEVVTPSPDRVTPPCAHAEGPRPAASAPRAARAAGPAAQRCGGCPWMALAVTAQRRLKGELVADALRRLGGVTLPAPPAVHGGAATLAYRGRVRFHVDPAGRIGLYARDSHEVVEVAGCAVAEPAIDAALGAVRQLAAAHPGGLAAFGEVEIRTAPAGPPVLLRLSLRDREGGLSRSARALVASLRARYVVGIEGEPEPAEAAQRWPLPGGVELHAPSGAFTQVNREQNQQLVEAVVGGAAQRGARTFLDLFAGAGNFALALAAAGLKGEAVEVEGSALTGARRAARAAHLEELTFIAGDAAKVLARRVRQGAAWDLAVIDPPRAGAREVMSAVADAGIPHLAMVSCDPPTLARDLKALLAAGYRVESVECFDFFPHTAHVETLAWLGR